MATVTAVKVFRSWSKTCIGALAGINEHCWIVAASLGVCASEQVRMLSGMVAESTALNEITFVAALHHPHVIAVDDLLGVIG